MRHSGNKQEIKRKGKKEIKVKKEIGRETIRAGQVKGEGKPGAQR